MFYCPNCGNVYDITKKLPTKIELIGGNDSIPTTVSSTTNETESNIDIIIKKILGNEKISLDDVKHITSDNLKKDQKFKRLQNKHKDVVFNKISEINPKFDSNVATNVGIAKTAYFICNNCKTFEEIKRNTNIVRKVSTNLSTSFADQDMDKYKDYKNMPYLPRTRNYVCKNQKCASHLSHEKREAVFYRIPKTFKTVYICCECSNVQGV